MESSSRNDCPSPSVQVRLANPEDVEGITIVINSAFRLSEEFFVDADRVDAGGVLNLLNSGKFLLAESEGLLLGCVYVELRLNSDRSAVEAGDRAYLGLLAVDPAHQQTGLGSVLMKAAEDYCSELGVGFIDIRVVSLREELCGFYRRRGYLETGTSPFPVEVKTKVPCHFIDMSKPLKPNKTSQA